MDAAAKRDQYEHIVARLELALTESDDPVSRMATAAALLFRYFDGFVWTGFYVLRDRDLVVGPYIGAPAAVKLPRDTGVCWSALRANQTVVVPNVHEFLGHVRVEGASNSEISVPLRDAGGAAIGLLHVDHSDFDAFDQQDVEALERIAALLGT